jgi:hypothetical protein
MKAGKWVYTIIQLTLSSEGQISQPAKPTSYSAMDVMLLIFVNNIYGLIHARLHMYILCISTVLLALRGKGQP